MPGPASAITTMIPRDLHLAGDVGGEGEEEVGGGAGCSLTLQSFDFMGNRCTEGGAPLVCAAASSDMTARTSDNGDGTYTMAWHSQRAGKHPPPGLTQRTLFSLSATAFHALFSLSAVRTKCGTGKHQVSAYINNDALLGSPFEIELLPGAPSSSSHPPLLPSPPPLLLSSSPPLLPSY